MTKSDRIFQRERGVVEPFAFNSEVAEVFDDMISRSVPFYRDVQDAAAVLVKHFFSGRGIIYDLGCSTGNTMYSVARLLDSDHARITGFDSSAAMVEKCREKLSQFTLKGTIEVVQRDLHSADLPEAEIILLNYTLQFIPEDQKQALISRIYTHLQPNGLLVLSDKVIQTNSNSNQLFIEMYHEFKRSRGYTELEISRKRDSLETVLTPMPLHELRRLLQTAGFSRIDLFFKWFNFASLVAVK